MIDWYSVTGEGRAARSMTARGDRRDTSFRPAGCRACPAPGSVATGSETPLRFGLRAFRGARGVAALRALAVFIVAAAGTFAVPSAEAQDTTAPSLSSAAVNAAGSEITLTFDEALSTATGNTAAATAFKYTVDGTTTTASSVSTSGSTVTVQSISPAIESGQIVVVEYTEPANDNAIQDAAGNKTDSFTTGDGTPMVPAVTNGSTVVGPPRIKEVRSINAPGPATDYNFSISSRIQVRVEFREAVLVAGTPKLALDFDGTPKEAACQGHASGSVNVTCVYEVAEGDSDTDGYVVPASALTLPTSSDKITRSSDTTVDAVLTHGAVEAGATRKVDAIKPTVSSAETSADGTQVIVTSAKRFVRGRPAISQFSLEITRRPRRRSTGTTGTSSPWTCRWPPMSRTARP